MAPRYVLLEVAGTRFHQEALAKLKMSDPVQLKREPLNPHDKNAIAVVGPGDEVLGYIPAIFAKEMAELIDTGSEVPGLEVAKKRTALYGGQSFLTLTVTITLKESMA